MSQEEELTLEGMDLPAILREDACRRFANLHCQDIDLLHISRMIMHGGSSLVAVGVCLNVDRTMITAIEKDDLCPRQQDKIHKILTEWQWNNTQNSTWATLTKCLLILEDPKLMDDIQAYLSQKEYPSNGMFLKVTLYHAGTLQKGICYFDNYRSFPHIRPPFCNLSASQKRKGA